ncbi:unnamed protein product [Leuciscus chuanchicus]
MQPLNWDVLRRAAVTFRLAAVTQSAFKYGHPVFKYGLRRTQPSLWDTASVPPTLHNDEPFTQGGNVTSGDGTGGRSIYGGKFEDENFEVRHTGPGLLSMANRGRDTNSSQFFITLKKAEHLDFKHVAFGFVKEGMDVVKRIAKLGTKDGKPTKTITVSDCGQL